MVIGYILVTLTDTTYLFALSLQEYDEHGRIKKKKKKYHDGASGSEYEYEYDRDGNVIGKTKTKEGNKAKKHITRDKFDDDDGNYFEKVCHCGILMISLLV